MQPYRRLQLFRSSFTGWALGLALLLGGCGGGSSGGDEPIASVTAEVGASGGALALQGLALTVAPNAVTGPVTVGVVALTAGTGEIARFQLSPAGRALGVASELRFSRAGLPAKTSFFWDVGGELRLVPSTLVGDVLTAQVSSLGLSASGSVVSALASTSVGRVKALFAKTLADAPGDGGTVVVKPLDCAADIAKMAARLKVVASGRDQELTIRFYDELVAVKQLCLEAEVQALKDSSCDAMGTAQSKAETVLADSFLTFQELTLPLFAAEAFVQETGATCPSADSARVGPLIADKFDQFLRVLQSQQLRGGFAEESTARDFQVLLDLNARCRLLGLDAVCERLNNEIIPNLFDGMRRGAFDECRSSGSPLVVSQLHFLGTMVTDTDRFLGVGRFGLGDVEADLMYCTNPTLDLRVFADATGVPDELTDRATTLSPLVGLGNYARVKTIELPRDGSLTVAGDVAALRCADGSVSPADLVARIGTREVARRSVSGNVYSLSTAPLDLVVSRILASAGLDVDTTKAFTVSINREGGQCLGVLGPTLSEPFGLFEIRVNVPPPAPVLAVVKLVALDGGLSGGASASPLTGTPDFCPDLFVSFRRFTAGSPTDADQTSCAVSVAEGQASRTSAATYTITTGDQGIVSQIQLSAVGLADSSLAAGKDGTAEAQGAGEVAIDLRIETPVLASFEFDTNASGDGARAQVAVSTPLGCSGPDCALFLQACTTTATSGSSRCFPSTSNTVRELPATLLMQPGTYRFTAEAGTGVFTNISRRDARSGAATASMTVRFAPAN